jgi:hypothetical protein
MLGQYSTRSVGYTTAVTPPLSFQDTHAESERSVSVAVAGLNALERAIMCVTLRVPAAVRPTIRPITTGLNDGRLISCTSFSILLHTSLQREHLL